MHKWKNFITPHWRILKQPRHPGGMRNTGRGRQHYFDPFHAQAILLEENTREKGKEIMSELTAFVENIMNRDVTSPPLTCQTGSNCFTSACSVLRRIRWWLMITRRTSAPGNSLHSEEAVVGPTGEGGVVRKIDYLPFKKEGTQLHLPQDILIILRILKTV